jgi:hypothetical protein
VQDRWAKAFYALPRRLTDQIKELESPQSSDDDQEESIQQEAETHAD